MHDEKDNASSTETSNLLLMICKIFLARAIVLARVLGLQVLVSPNVMNCPVCYRLCCLMICTEAAESLALTDRTNNAVITRTNKQYCMNVKKCNVMHVASNCGYENKNDNYEDKQTAPAVITGTNTQ